MSETISVIVPVYNVERCIGKCIESIRGQTYQELEIILVDDGSTDSSGRICDQYAEKDARIKVLHKQNEGLSDARNSGLEICAGKYVGFIDGDDWIAEDMYEFLYNTLNEHQADVAVCGHFMESDEDGVYGAEGDDGEVRVYNTREAVKAVVEDRLIHSYAWDKLYKRETFEGIRYPSGRYVQDIFTTYRVFMNAERVVCANVAKYYYYQRKNSIQRTRGEKLNWDQFSVYLERIHVLEKDYPELREFLIVSLLKFSVGAYNCLLLQDNLSQEQLEHKRVIQSAILQYGKELWKLPGYVELKIRLFFLRRKCYPGIYKRVKK